ncbi:efflux RND transporter permease subunit [Pelagicoccus enzymogenes]|uniref:efflux RND transporter permease subunit n=1 Tax=Pelagicoccus enzymogenes TaxID=2773457 RepID=UPI00280C5511|nr:efflux RND transporter permease subunit [Pelagicoccus enzymogenes]MDQ8198244.1 efflux RND transporter permease subunit [Pelagicoccus enzymogenes]
MFDAIIGFSLKNRALVLIAATALLAGGFFNAFRLPIDVFPDLNAPTVTLLTEAHGMAPEQVEALVTFPLESAVNGATGVRRVRSFSAPGISIVHVEFDWEMDVYAARQIVSEKLQAALGALPPDIPKPVMAPMASIMGEIMLIGLYADGDNVSEMELRTLADWSIRRRLLAVPGIAQVVPIGGKVKEYQINIDPERLATYGITLEQAYHAATKASENASGGVLRSKGKEYQIRGLGRAYTVDQIARSVVARQGQASILMEDIATVEVGPGLSFGTASANGEPAVVLSITKQPGSNTLTLTEGIESALADIQKSLPEGVVIQKDSFRQADFINVAVANVLEALRDGAILVVVILFLFLGNFRITLISVLAIPLSIAATFLVFRWMGVSLNTMSLGGIGIAIGALVDDAIIDVENVFRRLRENHHLPSEKKQSVNAVVLQASKEIRKPMVSATLIITIVFLPLFFLSGVEGRLLQPMGFAYIISIFASLAIALTVTPVLAALMLPSARNISNESEGWLAGLLKPMYRKTLDIALAAPWLSILASLALFISALAIAPFLGRSFLPEFNEGALTISYVTAPGTSLDESDELGRMVEKSILEVDGVLSVQRRTGRAELDEHAQPVNAGELEVVLDIEAVDREVAMEETRQALARIAGAQFTVGQPISHRIDHMLSGTRASIAVKLFGPELDELRRVAGLVEGEMEQVSGIVDLAVEPMVNTPQIAIRFDREAMALRGVTSGQLGEMIDVAFNGEVAGRVLEGQKAFDIVVRYERESRDSLETIRNALVNTPSGDMLPLSEFAQVEYDMGPNQIGRENAQRKLVVQANVAGRDLGSVIADIQNRVGNNVAFPAGYYVEYGGQFESEQAASRAIGILSLVSLVAIFLILYYQFGNVRDTLFALVNLPLALIGGVWAVQFTDGIVSIASLVGFITLFGIAARNGILLISHYQTLMSEGKPLTEAVKQGSLERLNPILMTALTAALALIPLALGVGEPGKELEAPMAIVILGGLITSTFLNMVVVPSLYARFGKQAAAS